MKHGFTIKWYHIFSNSFYFIRRGLFSVIRIEAPEFKGNLLDFGSGSKPYQHLFTKTSSYVGLDIEVSGHSNSNKKADVYYDGRTIPFPDAQFDSVFSSEVFEHVFNIEEILPEINRVLKPGGTMLITCPFVWPEHEVPFDYARYSSYGIKALLERHGFRVVRQYKTGHYIEVVVQQLIVYLFFLLPKKPLFLYYILHQIFILPLMVITLLLNLVLPSRLKRKDFYHNNVLVAVKTT